MKESREEFIQEAEVVYRWSKKRIVIGLMTAFVIIGGGIYTITLMSPHQQVLGTSDKGHDKPQIELPTAKKVEQAIQTAKDEIAKINPQNVVASQPQIQKVIHELQQITTTSSSAKNVICDMVCK